MFYFTSGGILSCLLRNEHHYTVCFCLMSTGISSYSSDYYDTVCFCPMSIGMSSYSSKTIMTLCASVRCQLAYRRIPQRLLWHCVFLSDVNWHVVVFLKDYYDTVCICLMHICINLPSLPHPHPLGAQTRVRAHTHIRPGARYCAFAKEEALHDIGIKVWTVSFFLCVCVFFTTKQSWYYVCTSDSVNWRRRLHGCCWNSVLSPMKSTFLCCNSKPVTLKPRSCAGLLPRWSCV